jgi:hypothetical protein
MVPSIDLVDLPRHIEDRLSGPISSRVVAKIVAENVVSTALPQIGGLMKGLSKRLSKWESPYVGSAASGCSASAAFNAMHSCSIALMASSASDAVQPLDLQKSSTRNAASFAGCAPR